MSDEQNKMDAYEDYKLVWMLVNHYTLNDLLLAMGKVANEELIHDNQCTLDKIIDEVFEIVESEKGLNGKRWLSKNEFYKVFNTLKRTEVYSTDDILDIIAKNDYCIYTNESFDTVARNKAQALLDNITKNVASVDAYFVKATFDYDKYKMYLNELGYYESDDGTIHVY